MIVDVGTETCGSTNVCYGDPPLMYLQTNISNHEDLLQIYRQVTEDILADDTWDVYDEIFSSIGQKLQTIIDLEQFLTDTPDRNTKSFEEIEYYHQLQFDEDRVKIYPQVMKPMILQSSKGVSPSYEVTCNFKQLKHYDYRVYPHEGLFQVVESIHIRDGDTQETRFSGTQPTQVVIDYVMNQLPDDCSHLKFLDSTTYTIQTNTSDLQKLTYMLGRVLDDLPGDEILIKQVLSNIIKDISSMMSDRIVSEPDESIKTIEQITGISRLDQVIHQYNSRTSRLGVDVACEIPRLLLQGADPNVLDRWRSLYDYDSKSYCFY